MIALEGAKPMIEGRRFEKEVELGDGSLAALLRQWVRFMNGLLGRDE